MMARGRLYDATGALLATTPMFLDLTEAPDGGLFIENIISANFRVERKGRAPLTVEVAGLSATCTGESVRRGYTVNLPPGQFRATLIGTSSASYVGKHERVTS